MPWFGVRNFQARNFMRNEMPLGDGVLFYHSSCPEPGIAGLAEVASAAYPDATQFDPTSHYYDPKSTPEAPRWYHVDVQAASKKTRLLSLAEMRAIPSSRRCGCCARQPPVDHAGERRRVARVLGLSTPAPSGAALLDHPAPGCIASSQADEGAHREHRRGIARALSAARAARARALGLARASSACCFHYPRVPDDAAAAQGLHVDAMRLLLFWSLVASGALASSTSSWAGALAGTRPRSPDRLPLPLGGHKVPVNDFADGTPYIGLDWFILDLLGSTLIFVFIEKRSRCAGPAGFARVADGFQHFVVNHMIVGFVLLPTNLLVHKLFGWAAEDGSAPGCQLPPIVPVPIVLVADLVQYWTHRAYTRCRRLAPARVHHSVKSMDWLAGSRQHILELIITRTPCWRRSRARLQQGSDRRLHRHRRLPGGVQPRQRRAAARAAALRDRHAQLPPLAPLAGAEASTHYAAHFAFLDFSSARAQGRRRWPTATAWSATTCRRLLQAAAPSAP